MFYEIVSAFGATYEILYVFFLHLNLLMHKWREAKFILLNLVTKNIKLNTLHVYITI